jgi:hypothetical protein
MHAARTNKTTPRTWTTPMAASLHSASRVRRGLCFTTSATAASHPSSGSTAARGRWIYGIAHILNSAMAVVFWRPSAVPITERSAEHVAAPHIPWSGPPNCWTEPSQSVAAQTPPHISLVLGPWWQGSGTRRAASIDRIPGFHAVVTLLTALLWLRLSLSRRRHGF